MKPLSRRKWKRIESEIADRFEGVLDHVKRLDRITFSSKREVAEVAAAVVVVSLRAWGN